MTESRLARHHPSRFERRTMLDFRQPWYLDEWGHGSGYNRVRGVQLIRWRGRTRAYLVVESKDCLHTWSVPIEQFRQVSEEAPQN